MYRKQMNNNSMKKPYCKVCHDAGKPESEYTSHHVKSLPDKLTGICSVTCPTLLNTECRFCFNIGHTAKFCPVVADKKKTTERATNRTNRVEPPRPQIIKKQDRKGGFSVLADFDDEKDVIVPKKEEYPALCEPSKRVISYASLAAKPAAELPTKQEQLPIGFQLLQKGIRYEKTEIEKPIYKPMVRRNWADDSSDDDEEEVNIPYTDNTAW
jgi:hypothetical protein